MFPRKNESHKNREKRLLVKIDVMRWHVLRSASAEACRILLPSLTTAIKIICTSHFSAESVLVATFCDHVKSLQ